MRELGRVVRIEEGKGIVQMEAQGGCKHCGMNTYCHATGTGTRELKLGLRGLDVSPGDVVEIETSARSLLTASFLVFILPLILSIVAYWGVHAATGDTGYGLLGFFGCFVVSEVLIYGLDKLFGKRRFFEPRIVRSVKAGSPGD